MFTIHHTFRHHVNIVQADEDKYTPGYTPEIYPWFRHSPIGWQSLAG